jgi:signal transduction histidine kinase
MQRVARSPRAVDLSTGDRRRRSAGVPESTSGVWQGSASRRSVTVLFVALSVATAVFAILPGLRFTVEAPRVTAALETISATVAALAAVLAYFRYAVTGARAFLFLALAFIAIGANRFVFGVVAEPAWLEPKVGDYVWTTGRLTMAALLLLGTTRSAQVRRVDAEPLRDLVVGTGAVLALMAVVDATTWMARGSLPPLTVGAGDVVPTVGFEGLTALGVTFAVLGAGSLLVAAYLYTRPATAAEPRFLAPALVLAAFSHVHYLLVPTVFSEWISTGDLLRLAFSATVLVGLFVDVRRAYRAEQTMVGVLSSAYASERERVLELETLDRSRAELLRMATHELLHPVSTVRSWVVTLQRRWRDLDDDRKLEILRELDLETQRLRDVAERAPEVSGPRDLTFPLALADVSVADLVHEASSSPEVADGLLAVSVAPEVREACVCADATRVLQVLWNLLSNARKHAGPAVPVELSVRRVGETVEFTVADRGPGISPEDVDRVFDLAYRAKPDGDREPPGSGLGLYVCRRIVEAHGGEIRAGNRPRGGAVVTFTLPLWDGAP